MSRSCANLRTAYANSSAARAGPVTPMQQLALNNTRSASQLPATERARHHKQQPSLALLKKSSSQLQLADQHQRQLSKTGSLNISRANIHQHPEGLQS